MRRSWRTAARPGLRAAAAVAVLALAAGCAPVVTAAGTPGARPPAAGPASATPAAPAPAGDARRRRAARGQLVPVPPAYAALPQTRALPSAAGAGFRAEMTDLWAAVVTGRTADGLQAFFPLGAYRQVKAIADPAADWHSRLAADFALDVAAAHQLLGRAARTARLVRVIVPEDQASWIDPGVCYNGVGYWHVAGARIVYRAGGQLRSIGIASLISWRGRWYVVHFGAVLRSSAAGIVDQPAGGPGVTGPPGGC